MTTIEQIQQPKPPASRSERGRSVSSPFLIEATVSEWPESLPLQAQDPAVLLADHAAHPFAFEYMRRLARWIVDAGMAPKSFKGRPEGVAVAMLHGARLGLDPLASVQSVAVVNGMPTVWGDALPALLKKAGARIEETLPEEFGQDAVALCVVTTPDGQRVERRFSWAMAQKARLLSKEGPWQNYPLRMLQMRARAWACRDAMPEVLKGFGVGEEQQDVQQNPVATLVETPNGSGILPTVDGMVPTGGAAGVLPTVTKDAAAVRTALAGMHFDPQDGDIWLDIRSESDPGTFRIRIGEEWRPVSDDEDNFLRVMIKNGALEKQIREWALRYLVRAREPRVVDLKKGLETEPPRSADEATPSQRLDAEAQEAVDEAAGEPEDEEPVKEVDLGAEPREPKLWETRSRRRPKNAVPGDMWRNEADGTTQVLDIDGEWFLPANAREAAEWLCAEIADAANAGQEPRSFRATQEATEQAPSEDETPPDAAPVSEGAPDASVEPGAAQPAQIEGQAADLQQARDRFRAVRARLKLEHTDVSAVVEALITDRRVESMGDLTAEEITSVVEELELRHG